MKSNKLVLTDDKIKNQSTVLSTGLLLKNTPVSKKLSLTFGVIFGIILLFTSYALYVFHAINQSVELETVNVRVAALTFNLNTIVLNRVILLSQYNDVYDQSLIADMKTDRKRAVKYEAELRQLTKNSEIIQNINAYEALYAQRQKLEEQVIQAVDHHESFENIISIRQQREALDNQSISYLNRILEIANADLQQTIDYRNQLRNTLQHSLIWMTGIILMIGILASYWIISAVTSPIKVIDAMVRQVLQGNFNAKITVKSQDEFGKLASLLNYMVMKLKKSRIQARHMMKKLKGEVAEHKKAEKMLKIKRSEIKFMAYHDYLTGISNRAQFERLARKSLSQANRNHKRMAILFIDLDRFKTVNDTLGHSVGDLLLQEMSVRFLSIIRETDTLSRLGGDEFAVIADSVAEKKDVEMIAENLISMAKEPFYLNHHTIHVSASVGIAVYPDSGDTIPLLMKNADTALYKAKEAGKNTFFWYSEAFNIQAMQRAKIEEFLRNALLQKKFYLNYQPMFNLNDLSFYAVEALLRWDSSLFEHLTNDIAIPVAEETGLIIPIGDWVIETALKQYKSWGHQRLKGTKISINLSPEQLTKKDFFVRVQQWISSMNIEPENIIFELTETAIVKNMDTTVDALHLLRKLGCQVYIDDFGSGFSSLNLIQKLPISGLKIDKSFVQNASSSPKNTRLVEMIFLLAQSMNVAVISEGIENAEQLDFIKSFTEQQKVQGFYLSRPISATDIEKLLRVPRAM